MTGRVRRQRQDEGTRQAGNAMVEFVLWVPIVLTALCTCLQLMATLYDQRAVGQAVTSAVQAQQAGGDPVAAAKAALPPDAEEATVTVTHGSVRVSMTSRRFLILLPKKFAEVSATATAPERIDNS
jgi:Flp pilus assembly protein TadG